MTPPQETDIPLGVILAGGLARRMGGGDKSLHAVAGRPILAHIIERLRPQVTGLVLNANGDPARFASFGLEIISDTIAGHPGPLAGILAGLEHAAASGSAYIVTVPADTPFLPHDLVARLIAVRGDAPLAIAASAGRTHPVIGLWPVSMRTTLRAALYAGQRRVGVVAAGAAVATWPDHPIDPFFNVNTPDDLARATSGDPTPQLPHPAPS